MDLQQGSERLAGLADGGGTGPTVAVQRGGRLPPSRHGEGDLAEKCARSVQPAQSRPRVATATHPDTPSGYPRLSVRMPTMPSPFGAPGGSPLSPRGSVVRP